MDLTCTAAGQVTKHWALPLPLSVHLSAASSDPQQLMPSKMSQPWELVGTHCRGWGVAACFVSKAGSKENYNHPAGAAADIPGPPRTCRLGPCSSPGGPPGCHPHACWPAQCVEPHLLARAAAPGLRARAVQDGLIVLWVGFTAVGLRLALHALQAARRAEPAGRGVESEAAQQRRLNSSGCGSSTEGVQLRFSARAWLARPACPLGQAPSVWPQGQCTAAAHVLRQR